MIGIGNIFVLFYIILNQFLGAEKPILNVIMHCPSTKIGKGMPRFGSRFA